LFGLATVISRPLGIGPQASTEAKHGPGSEDWLCRLSRLIAKRENGEENHATNGKNGNERNSG
jgi:hypothetical protein